MDQFGLLAAHDEELLILGLPEADTDGQVQAHGPELNGAGEGTIHQIDGEDHEAEDVEDQDRQQHEPNLPHLHDRVLTLEPQKEACRVQEKGIHGREGNVGYAPAIEVLRSSDAVASGVEVNHVGVSRTVKNDYKLVHSV